MSKRKVSGSCGGGGSGLVAFLGAIEARSELCEVVRGAGASAGSMGEATDQFGLDKKKVKRVTFDALINGRLLKFRPDVWSGALVDWRILGDLVDELFGKGVKLGDVPKGRKLSVCVTPLNGGGPKRFTSTDHPRVLLRDVLPASSAFKVGITGAAQITSHLLGAYTPDPFWYVDGGRTDNVCDSVWDDDKEPNVALRLGSVENPENERVVRGGDLVSMVTAEELVTLWAANQPRTRRDDGKLVQVDGENLWSFKQTQAELEDQYDRGYVSAKAQIQEWLTCTSSTEVT